MPKTIDLGHEGRLEVVPGESGARLMHVSLDHHDSSQDAYTIFLTAGQARQLRDALSDLLGPE